MKVQETFSQQISSYFSFGFSLFQGCVSVANLDKANKLLGTKRARDVFKTILSSREPV